MKFLFFEAPRRLEFLCSDGLLWCVPVMRGEGFHQNRAMASETHDCDKRPQSPSDHLWARGPTRRAEPDGRSLDFADTMRELGLTLGGICAVFLVIILIVRFFVLA
jgi:hypothetical protein